MRPLHKILFGAFLLTSVPSWAQSLPDFSPYPRTGAFSYFISGHTNPAARTNLLLMTAFLSDKVALQYVVRTNGLENDYCEDRHPMGGCKAGHQKQLSDADLKRLADAIRKFPSYDRSPPIGNLLVVSFGRGTNWVNYSYRWDSPPVPVREALDIIGERFETRHQPIK
jgi:hypothetical protein